MRVNYPGLLKMSAIALLSLALAGCARAAKEAAVQSSLAQKVLRYAATTIAADTSNLSPGDQQALARLVEAAKIMDTVFLLQVWKGNPALLERLDGDASAIGLERLHYFLVNFGPWSRLERNAPFVPGVPPVKPLGANFYPEDMSRDEFEQWVQTLSSEDQQRARGFFWVVRRGGDRRLSLVSYNREYREPLERAAALLREASALTENASLKKYLNSRAEAFLTNDYYSSDVAWMELDAPLNVTIGPYETYEDGLFSYKAAFEAFIALRDDRETKDLARYGSYLQELEDNLPLDLRYRNPKLGALAPIRVVNEIFVGGEAKAGVQTAAFNLPNDPRVVKEKGSKRVMLKNVQEAKFESILKPISRVLLDPKELDEVSFRPFFIHIVAHELMHGLGPQDIRVGGRSTSVRLELKDLYSAVEEAKADITGLWALQYLIDHGKLEKELERPLYVTFLVSAFRSIRFGLNEAHGKGVALQFNFLSEEGAFVRDASSGRYRVDFDKIKPAVIKLTHEILTIEAEGSYARAKQLLEKYSAVGIDAQKALDQLKDVPVDLEPVFPMVLRRQ